jgi:Glycosyltransferase family 92
VGAAKSYLSVCSIYKDHAAYLPEWIEFHRLVGADRFFLYDNGSTDEHREVLAPYLELGIVELHEQRSPPSVADRAIRTAFNDCLERHRDDSRWIAFLDLDEFLFSPTGRPLPAVLEGFEQFAGVEVSTLAFGPSGHRTKPPGLVIESYLRRRAYRSPGRDLEQVKSVVDPSRAERNHNAHGFFYKDGYAVHEDGEPAGGEVPGSKAFPRASLLRINHYITRSVEEYMTKRAQWAAVGHDRRRPTPRFVERLSAEQDEAITTYVPALREALANPVARR